MILLEQVSRVFQVGGQEVRALNQVNLEVGAGEYLSIMGPSGSGKSTLLNILGLLDRASKGRYLLDGRDVTSLPDKELAATRALRIGFVFQFFHLVPRLSAQQNVELPLLLAGVPARERAARSLELLTAFGLGERARHRPDELSGGQRQRVAIARAMVNRPKILLADEPTGNLDTQTTQEVLALLDTLNREHGLTIVVVTHETDVAAHARRLVRLKDGRVVYDGTTVDAAQWAERRAAPEPAQVPPGDRPAYPTGEGLA